MKIINRIAAALLTITMAFSFSACGQTDVQKAESQVSGVFTALKNSDLEEAANYLDINELESGSSDSLDPKLIMDVAFRNLDFKIISSEQIDSNTVSVKTEITATDMKPIFSEFLVNVMQYAVSSATAEIEPTEAELQAKVEEIFSECASKEDLATVTNEVDIIVAKNENNEWEIQADDALTDAMFGGLLSVANEMNNSFNLLDSDVE